MDGGRERRFLGWRKILRLRSALLPYIEFKIGDGESFSLWHDPWHSLGSLITRFPRGPGRTSIPEAAKLSAVLVDGDWSWPPITDLECIEILHVLPNIHNGSDSILWRGGGFSTKAVYDIFRNHGPKWVTLTEIKRERGEASELRRDECFMTLLQLLMSAIVGEWEKYIWSNQLFWSISASPGAKTAQICTSKLPRLVA
ncbi:UNVERIFIED_CONTAM: hypothetical protein Sangu_3057800 [Sesamum angustifolium]|uniref:Uncharacterized protein n=1 Tax=Sesamum angustifolium TaxID=2727405 RepID=A0AAW2KDI1_9LAMI